MRNLFEWVAAFAAVVLFGIFMVFMIAITPTTPLIESDSTVYVDLGGGHGSAVHIGDGYFLTANHVVDNVETVTLIDSNDLEWEAVEVLWTNEKYDVALLYNPSQSQFLGTLRELAIDSAELSCEPPSLGDEVWLRGNPVDIRDAQTYGHVASGPMEAGPWGEVITIGAPIGPGMSGGGLFNANDELVGINVGAPLFSIGQGGSTMGLGYSVPANILCHLLAKEF